MEMPSIPTVPIKEFVRDAHIIHLSPDQELPGGGVVSPKLPPISSARSASTKASPPMASPPLPQPHTARRHQRSRWQHVRERLAHEERLAPLRLSAPRWWCAPEGALEASDRFDSAYQARTRKARTSLEALRKQPDSHTARRSFEAAVQIIQSTRYAAGRQQGSHSG